MVVSPLRYRNVIPGIWNSADKIWATKSLQVLHKLFFQQAVNNRIGFTSASRQKKPD